MKTFLAQNQFLSAASLQLVAEAAASSPLSSLSEAAVSNSNPDGGYMGPRLSPALGTSVNSEAVGTTAAASDLDQLANYLRRRDSRFVPDKAAIWDAMFDETAPRLRADDPVWADEAPLFLKRFA